MAAETPHKWILLGDEDGVPQEGPSLGVAINTPNPKLVVVSGTVTSVQIEVLAQDKVTWVPLQDGLFTVAGARFMEGLSRSMQIRASTADTVLVEVYK